MHDVAKGISNVPVQSNARPRRRARGIGIAIGLLIAILFFVFGIKALQIGKMMSTKMEMPPTTVSSATVKEEDWAPTLDGGGIESALYKAQLFPQTRRSCERNRVLKTAPRRRRVRC